MPVSGAHSAASFSHRFLSACFPILSSISSADGQKVRMVLASRRAKQIKQIKQTKRVWAGSAGAQPVSLFTPAHESL